MELLGFRVPGARLTGWPRPALSRTEGHPGWLSGAWKEGGGSLWQRGFHRLFEGFQCVLAPPSPSVGERTSGAELGQRRRSSDTRAGQDPRAARCPLSSRRHLPSHLLLPSQRLGGQGEQAGSRGV